MKTILALLIMLLAVSEAHAKRLCFEGRDDISLYEEVTVIEEEKSSPQQVAYIKPAPKRTELKKVQVKRPDAVQSNDYYYHDKEWDVIIQKYKTNQPR